MPHRIARIMACDRRASNRVRGARDIPDGDSISQPHRTGSQLVENFVDNRPGLASYRRVESLVTSAARKKGTENLFDIKGLPNHPAAGAGGMVCNANARAAVELSGRSNGRCADG